MCFSNMGNVILWELLCFNGEDARVEFCLPIESEDGKWRVAIDTIEPQFVEEGRFHRGSDVVMVEGRSLLVLSCDT